MTAQVAILTSQGVALASDRIVTTVRGQRPVGHQTGTKIFCSEVAPLAVLMSHGSDLLGTYWEALIPTWLLAREHILHEHVSDYSDELASWLVAQPGIASDSAQDEYLVLAYQESCLELRDVIRGRLEAEMLPLAPGYAEGSVAVAVDQSVDRALEQLELRSSFVGMDDVDADPLVRRIAPRLRDVTNWIFDDTPRTTHLDGQLPRLAARLITAAEPTSADTVLTFVGYGRSGHLPSLHSVGVSGVVDGRLRRYGGYAIRLGVEHPAAIATLGDDREMDEILGEVNPAVLTLAHRLLDMGTEGRPEADHQRLDEMLSTLAWQGCLSPLLQVVEGQPLTDTVRLADALATLASMRQVGAENGPAGGLIELAAISLERGAHWLRRQP